MTTINRRLQSLTTAGEIDALASPQVHETLSRRCQSSGHHHHLLCRRCGRTVELQGSEVEQWADRVARDRGFVDLAHTLEVFGTPAGPAPRRQPDS